MRKDRAAIVGALRLARATHLAPLLSPILILVVCAGACKRPEEPREDVRVVPQVKPVQPRRVAFAPDDESRLLILEFSGLVGVWDVRDPSRPVRMAWIPGTAIDAAFSADGKEVVTAGQDGRVRWWSSVGGQPLRTSGGSHQGPVRALAVGDDQVVSGGEDGALRIWNRDGTARGEPIAAHEGLVVSVAVGANGTLASAGTDEAIRLWQKDPSSPSGYRARVLYQQESSKLTPALIPRIRLDSSFGWDHALVFSPAADALAAAGYDGSVRLWRSADWSMASTLNEAGLNRVRALAWTARGDVLAAGGSDGEVARWNADGTSLGKITKHTAPILSVAFSRSGARFATTSSAGRVQLWGSDGALAAALPTGARLWTTTVALTAEGPLFASADGAGKLRRWRIDGSPAQEIPTGERRVVSIAFSPTGELLVAGRDDGTIELLGRDTDTVVKSGIWSFVDGVAVSPRGDILALAGNPGKVELRNSDGAPRTPAFHPCHERIYGLAFSPVEETLAILCDDGSVRLWTLDGKPRESLLEPGTGAHVGLAISPSAELFAAGGLDGVVGFWAFPARRLEQSLYVGLPIEQVGLHRGGSWVSANGNSVFFFDTARRLVATAVVAPEGVIVFTPDGWFAGSDGVERLARAFRTDGTPLSAAETARRVAPQKIAAALRGAS